MNAKKQRKRFQEWAKHHSYNLTWKDGWGYVNNNTQDAWCGWFNAIDIDRSRKRKKHNVR